MNESSIDPVILPERVPAPSGLRAVLAVFRLNRLAMIKGRRGVFLGLLLLVPVAAALLSQILQKGNRGTAGFIDMTTEWYLAALLPILFLFLGCAAVGDEIEGRTITYLLIRPIPRWSILLGRFGSYLLAALVLLVPSVVLTFAVCMSRFDFATIADRLPLLFAVLFLFTLAAFAYGALFIFLSVMVPWPVYVGIALTIGYEAIWIRVAPGSMHLISYVYHLHVVGYELTKESAFKTQGLSQSLGAAEDPTLGGSLQVLIIAPLVFLLLAWLRFRRKEYAFN